jgi:predicted nucleic acid-binding protein
VSVFYADTSALVRAYIAAEPDHESMRAMLLEGGNDVFTSEIARVEFAGAVRSAERARQIRNSDRLLTLMDADCDRGGPIALVRLRPESVLPTARDLIIAYRLRTLDALHLAVALEEMPLFAGEEAFTFVTLDREQEAAARALGFTVQ